MKVTKVEIFDIECPKRPQWNPVSYAFTPTKVLPVWAKQDNDWGHSAAAHDKEIAEAMLIGFNPFTLNCCGRECCAKAFGD